MIKNTKANLTLLFCINKKNSKLATALEAIARQTDKNFNIIFIFNGAGMSEKDIFQKYDFRSINKVDHVFVSENMGDTYAFKYCQQYIQTKYVYYFDSNVILHPDCVASINLFLQEHPETDILSFFGVPNIYFKEPFIKIKTLSDDFLHRPLVSFDNKVLNLEYLKTNKIEEPLFKNWSVYFYVTLIKANPVWYSIGRRLCDITHKPLYQYNVMDLFEQCEALVELLDEKPYKDHASEIEYLCMVTLFRNFIYAYFTANKGKPFQHKRILDRVEIFMNKNFPRWQSNEFLNEKINKNDKSYIDYLKGFKPKLIHVYRTITNKDFLKGYGKQK